MGVLTHYLGEEITRKRLYILERASSRLWRLGLWSQHSHCGSSEESIKHSRLKLPSVKCLQSMISKIICKLETLSRFISLSVKYS